MYFDGCQTSLSQLAAEQGVDPDIISPIVNATSDGSTVVEALLHSGLLDKATLRDILLDHHASHFASLMAALSKVDDVSGAISAVDGTGDPVDSAVLVTLHTLVHLASEQGSEVKPVQRLRTGVPPKRKTLDYNQSLQEALEQAQKSSESGTRASIPAKMAGTLMADIKTSMQEIMALDGAIATALVDWESGLTLGSVSNTDSFDIELAASGNTKVVQMKMQVMKELGITGGIEDILITLNEHYHLIRPLAKAQSLFFYVSIDKSKGNLGLARHTLRQIENALDV